MQDCGNVLWALGRLRLLPPPEWIDALVEASFSQLPYFSTQQYANAVWAWAALRAWPPPLWSDRFFLETRPRLLAFRAAEIAQLLLAFGALRVAPPRQWLDQLLIAAYPRLPLVGARELTQILWGLARLGYQPNARWAGAAGGAAARLLPGLPPRERKKLAAVVEAARVGQPAGSAGDGAEGGGEDTRRRPTAGRRARPGATRGHMQATWYTSSRAAGTLCCKPAATSRRSRGEGGLGQSSREVAAHPESCSPHDSGCSRFRLLMTPAAYDSSSS
eukprot:365538-Chlamydomonas_euryale.AAC.2